MKLKTATLMAAIGAMAQILCQGMFIAINQLAKYNAIEYNSTVFLALNWAGSALAIVGSILVCIFFFVLFGKQK